MKNIAQNQTNSTEKVQAAMKTAYRKQDVEIVLYGFDAPKLLAFAFALDIGGTPFKGIICNGKCRRRERRKAIEVLLNAFRIDYLQEIKFLNRDDVRGAFIFSKDEEVKDA